MTLEKYPTHTLDDDVARMMGEDPDEKAKPKVEPERGDPIFLRYKESADDHTPTDRTRVLELERFKRPYTREPEYVIANMADGVTEYFAGRGSGVIFLQKESMSEWAQGNYKFVQSEVPGHVIEALRAYQSKTGIQAVPENTSKAESQIRARYADASEKNTYEMNAPKWLQESIAGAYFLRSQIPPAMRGTFDDLFKAEIAQRLVTESGVSGSPKFSEETTPITNAVLDIFNYRMVQEAILVHPNTLNQDPMRYEIVGLDMYAELREDAEKKGSKVTEKETARIKEVQQSLARKLERSLETIQYLVADSASKEK